MQNDNAENVQNAQKNRRPYKRKKEEIATLVGTLILTT